MNDLDTVCETAFLSEDKCEMSGIGFICNEESYTSKCDALACEPVGKHDTYLGRRIKRGLFRSSVGKLINAEILDFSAKIARTHVVRAIFLFPKQMDNPLIFSRAMLESVPLSRN